MPVPTPHSCIRGSYIFHSAFPSLSQRLQISLLNNQANDLRVLFVYLRLHTFSFIFLSPLFLSSPTCLLLSLFHLPFAALLHLHYDSYRLLLLSRLFVYFNPRVCPLYHPTSFSSQSSHFTQPTIFLFLFVTAPLQFARLLFLSSPPSSFYYLHVDRLGSSSSYSFCYPFTARIEHDVREV